MVAKRIVTELTVTTFVFRRSDVGCTVGLVHHRRFNGLLPPGGHVESGETPDQAAVRETREELGCEFRLVAGPALPVPAGFPHTPVAGPWWTVEMPACADSHTPVPHIHQDHVFAGVWLRDVQEPETEVQWLSEAEIAEFPALSEDSRLQAKALFAQLSDILD